MLWLLNRYVIGAVVAAILLAYTHSSVYRAGKASVQSAWDKERAQAAVDLAAAQEKVRKTEFAMNDAAAKYARDKYDALRALNDRHRALVDSLRERAPRAVAGQMPGSAGAAESAREGTGAGLHREDAEFLAGEAARADEIRAELLSCYQHYEAARAAMTRN